MGTTQTKKPPVRKNGEFPASAAWGNIGDAVSYEEAIATEAETIRGQEFVGLDVTMFLRLWPLLTRSLHAGHVIHTTAGKGKPYPSDGARSAQVLIDRMNNVLTPLCWDYREEYSDGGKLCKVTVTVFDKAGVALVSRSSWGGVGQGSTAGNIYKGSFTNAAKLAFARLGPGHEIYVGVVDFDPDVNADIAKAQARTPSHAERTGNADKQPAAGDVEAAVRVSTPEEELAALLLVKDDLDVSRMEAEQGMGLLGASPAQRLRELQSAQDEPSLNALLGRITTALEAQGEES